MQHHDGSNGVLVYYRDLEVTVTDTAVMIGARAFRIVDLEYVWHQRGRQTWRTLARRLSRIVLIAVLTAPVVALGVIVGDVMFAPRSLPARAVAALVVITVGVIALMLLSPVFELPMMALERSYDRGTAVREIWVRWRDQDLMILRTTDASRFGRIYRAIERAVERVEG
jgi:uncharacterized protein DUF6232